MGTWRAWTFVVLAAGLLWAGPAWARDVPTAGHVQIYGAGEDGLLVEIVLEGHVLPPDTSVVEAHFDGLRLCFEGDPTVEELDGALTTRLRYFAIPTRGGPVEVRGFELETADGDTVWVGGRPEGTVDSEPAADRTDAAATYHVDRKAFRERSAAGPLECSDFDLADVDWDHVIAEQRKLWQQQREERVEPDARCTGLPRLETLRVVDVTGGEVREARTSEALFLEAVVSGNADGMANQLRLRHLEDFGVLAGPEQVGVTETPDGRCRWTWRWRIAAPVPGSHRAPDVELVLGDGVRTETLRGPLFQVTGQPLVGVPSARGMVSHYGGWTLRRQANGVFRRGFRAEAGWPGLRLAYVQPVHEALDLSPTLRVLWGRHTDAGVFGLEPGVELRRTVLEDGPWSLAVLGEAALVSIQDTGSGGGRYGVLLGTGVAGGYRVQHDLSLSGGLRLRPTILGGGDATLRVPLLVDFAAEYQVMQEADMAANLGVLMSIGPDLCASGGCGGHDLVLEAGVGVTVSWKSGR